jgi:hypothetical protein
MICGHRQHSIAREIGGRHPGYWLATWWSMRFGAVAIGMSQPDAMRLAIHCARDSIPPLRLAILLDVDATPESRPNDVPRRINKPWTTVKRELEALNMLGLLACDEETMTTKDLHEKTVWRYSLSEALWAQGGDGLDREILRLMGGRADLS